jgi:hypothetical protein
MGQLQALSTCCPLTADLIYGCRVRTALLGRGRQRSTIQLERGICELHARFASSDDVEALRCEY